MKKSHFVFVAASLLTTFHPEPLVAQETLSGCLTTNDSQSISLPQQTWERFVEVIDRFKATLGIPTREQYDRLLNVRLQLISVQKVKTGLIVAIESSQNKPTQDSWNNVTDQVNRLIMGLTLASAALEREAYAKGLFVQEKAYKELVTSLEVKRLQSICSHRWINIPKDKKEWADLDLLRQKLVAELAIISKADDALGDLLKKLRP